MLDDTDEALISLRIGADRAELRVTDIMTLLAVDDPFTHLSESMSKGLYIGDRA